MISPTQTLRRTMTTTELLAHDHRYRDPMR